MEDFETEIRNQKPSISHWVESLKVNVGVEELRRSYPLLAEFAREYENQVSEEEEEDYCYV